MDQYEFVRIAQSGLWQEHQRTNENDRTFAQHNKKAIRGKPWKYQERDRQPFPVPGAYLGIINDWLEEDKKQPKK